MPSTLGGIYERLQAARTELRHAAHVYARTPRANKPAREENAEKLERAALVVTLAAAEWGLVAGCARPAGKAGREWEARMDPEAAVPMSPSEKVTEHMTGPPTDGKKKPRAR